MNEEIRDKLLNEVNLGRIAKHSYDTYLKRYIEKKRLIIFNEFCSNGDPDMLIYIKQRQVALDELEQDTISAIDTMALAEKQLGMNND